MDDFDESDLEEALDGSIDDDSYDGGGNFNGFNPFSHENKEEDVRSINDRTGKNEEVRNTDEDYGKTSSKEKRRKQEDEDADDITGSSRGKDSDELDSTKSKGDKEESKGSGNYSDTDQSEKKEKEDKKEEKNKEEDDNSETKDDDKGKSKGKGLWGKIWAKYKWYIIAAIVGIAGFLIIAIVAFFVTLVDNLTLGLTNMFGVPETTSESTGNMPGLYDDDKYKYDANGNEMDRQDLVNYLENNSNCAGNFWTSLSDGWNALWGASIRDTCELIRYVHDKTSSTGVDEALIISTIFYGFDNRPTPDQYINPNDASSNETMTIEHYQSLAEVLQDKNISIDRAKIDKLVENAHAVSKSYYYEWVIDETKDSDGKVTSITGKCQYKEMNSDKYNLDKWKVYLRFGEQAASKFDEVVLKAKNFETSSEECKNTDDIYTKEKLEEEVKLAANSYGEGVGYTLDWSSVESARAALENPDATSSEVFYQAADLHTKTKDYFNGYNGISFDYKNGFAYKNFPSFGPSMEPGGVYYGKVNIQYDDVFTPKVVEQLIQDIVSRKTNLNEALFRVDPDTREDYSSSLHGYTGVPTGANCMPYLTAGLQDIRVKLTDCYGGYMDTTDFEDYIIGVANGEVSNSGDDYVLSQMVAAISYALRRHNNYTKGNEITMRSGTCDQVYCSMLRGCHGVNTPVGTCSICNTYYIGGGHKYPELYSKYQALYEIASDYLLVKDGVVFGSGYTSVNQNRWHEKASRGMSFTQIIQEEYGDDGATLIRCTDTSSQTQNPDLPEEESNKVGHKATTEYPNVAPDVGPFYGFSYKDGSDPTHITINPEWKNANLVTISPECSGNPDYAKKTYTVHKNAVTNFKKAFKNVCKILTQGVKLPNGSTCNYTVNDVSDGTVFIERKTAGGTFDLHAYGLAQDLNYSKKITVNGKEYTPYNTRELSEYLDFVNAIGGKEESCQNVNYILWSYAYKDAGFQWGGNYGRNGNSGSYDGKLFELVYR